MEIIDHPLPHVNKAIEWMKEKCPRYRNYKVSLTDGKCKHRDSKNDWRGSCEIKMSNL